MTFFFEEQPPEGFLDLFAESTPEVRRAFLNQIAARTIDPQWRQLHQSLSELHDLIGGELE